MIDVKRELNEVGLDDYHKCYPHLTVSNSMCNVIIGKLSVPNRNKVTVLREIRIEILGE